MSKHPQLLRAGERGVLVDLDSLDAVLELNRVIQHLREDDEGWSGIEDVIPAATTLLITTPSAETLKALRPKLDGLLAASDFRSNLGFGNTHRQGTETVEVPVQYDGEDLAEVAQLTGLSEAEVVAAHTARPWRVAFGGFAPGFSYLVDGDPRLEVPRRKEPRTAVPLGSVALAGNFSGVYPRQSPGGWQLIGHTDLPMWDADRQPPALLQPGALVQFVEVKR